MQCSKLGCETPGTHLVVISERPVIGVDEKTKAAILGPGRETARVYCGTDAAAEVQRITSQQLKVTLETYELRPARLRVGA